MVLKKKIPEDFYKLFRTKNRDAYMQIVSAIYEENDAAYSVLGLTQEECQALIGDVIAKARIILEKEEGEDAEASFLENSPYGILSNLVKWGWLQRDFDEKLNTDIISFPEYSQLFAELFVRLQKEDEGIERESILSIYSALFTYQSDTEKNNDILKNALRASKGLGQLLSNMQDGMRSYFDELSSKKNFIGIQQVLVEEINNSDSKKYAILTTVDSFYRYKEAVKELISQILDSNDAKREELLLERKQLEMGSTAEKRNQYALKYCEEANELVYQTEREFDVIERKYNKLIEQKTIFAKRALARIHYILQEGAGENDNTIKLINLLDRSRSRDKILEEMREKLPVSVQFKNVTDNSFAVRRERGEEEFVPIALQKEENGKVLEITDFVPKPLYTKRELMQFYQENKKDGKFTAAEETVKNAEDLEKLMLLWQEETNERLREDHIVLDGEITGKNGFTYSRLIIEMEDGGKNA